MNSASDIFWLLIAPLILLAAVAYSIVKFRSHVKKNPTVTNDWQPFAYLIGGGLIGLGIFVGLIWLWIGVNVTFEIL